MKKLTVIFFIILLFCGSVFSAPLEKRVLDNGLTLITQEDHSKDLISICAYVNGGSRTETPDLSGLTHYFEHLIFRGGTDTQAELEMRKAFLSLGTFYGYTYEDGTCYYITVPPENLPEALERYCDVLLNLKITGEKVETERGIVISEFGQSYFDVPSGMAYYNLYQTAYTTHSYGQTVIGDTAAVQSATLETFQKFYDERYTPDKFIIAAVGNFNTDELLYQFEKTFGQHSAGTVNLELNKVEPPQDEYKTVTYEMPASSVYSSLGFHIPPFSAPEFTALEILEYALFNNDNGILVEELTRKNNDFNYLGSWLDRTKDPGMWVIYANNNTETTENSFSRLFQSLREVAENGLTPEQISAAQKSLIRGYKIDSESFFKRAERYCLYELASNIGLAEQYENEDISVTPEAVRNIARRIITPENATLSLVIPEQSEAPESSEWGKLLRWIPETTEVVESTVNPVEEIILANGVSLLLQPNQFSETASMEILVRGGQWAEPSGLEGINNFMCQMFSRGTLEITGEELSEALAEAGVSLSAQASPDYSRISLSGFKDSFADGLKLAGLAATRTGYREDDIESVRRLILAEIESMPDETYNLTRQEFNAMLYDNNPYQHPIYGFEESIRNITAEDLKSFHDSIFTGNNIIISLTGNFATNSVQRIINDIFGEIEPGTKFQYNAANEHLPEKREVKVIDKDRSLTTYNLGWIAPSIFNEDYLPMQYVAYMLNKVVFFRFVYEEGICYRSWARYQASAGPGKFWFETGIAPSDYEFSWTETMLELKDFLNGDINEEMVALASGEAIQRMKLGTETNSDRAYTTAIYYLYGFGADYLDRFPEIAKSVTPGQVEKAAKKYLKTDKYTHLVVGKIK